MAKGASRPQFESVANSYPHLSCHRVYTLSKLRNDGNEDPKSLLDLHCLDLSYQYLGFSIQFRALISGVFVP